MLCSFSCGNKTNSLIPAIQDVINVLVKVHWTIFQSTFRNRWPEKVLPTELHNIVHPIHGHIGLYTNRGQYAIEQLSHIVTVPNSTSRSHAWAVHDRHETLREVWSTSLSSLLWLFAATPIHQAMVVWEQLWTSSSSLLLLRQATADDESSTCRLHCSLSLILSLASPMFLFRYIIMLRFLGLYARRWPVLFWQGKEAGGPCLTSCALRCPSSTCLLR